MSLTDHLRRFWHPASLFFSWYMKITPMHCDSLTPRNVTLSSAGTIPLLKFLFHTTPPPHSSNLRTPSQKQFKTPPVTLSRSLSLPHPIHRLGYPHPNPELVPLQVPRVSRRIQLLNYHGLLQQLPCGLPNLPPLSLPLPPLHPKPGPIRQVILQPLFLRRVRNVLRM
jgi:hypothetical protein